MSPKTNKQPQLPGSVRYGFGYVKVGHLYVDNGSWRVVAIVSYDGCVPLGVQVP